jgi:hypothetical protein
VKNPRQSRGARFVLASVSLLALTSGGLMAQNAPLVLDHASGFYESPFRLTISTPAGGTVFYTTNSTTPRPATGIRYNSAILVSTPTIVRAAAFDRDMAVSDLATRTYLFLSAIPKQMGAQLPKVWGTNGNQIISAHYEISPPPADASPTTLTAALRAIPSLSIVTDPENLFSAETGVYLHPMERGTDWERPAAVEIFDPDGAVKCQSNCGLRIHGGMSRRPEESPKHSLRLVFKRRYGPARLRFPLFGADDPQEFDELVLRAGSNDSWLDPNGEQRRQAAYVRDEWMRRTMRDMGHPSARGSFVHVYLNGLYWGVYNLCERPGGPLLAARSEARVAKYDVRKGGETESGDSVVWDRLMALANSSLNDEQSYRAISQHLDLPQVVDYLILNFYAGNSDWDRSANWYAIRPRIAAGKFQFFVWDGERTLENVEANTLDFDDDESPLRLFHKLSEHTAFRALFTERARQLLFGHGALAPEAAAKRFRTLVNLIAKPLVAESARWGGYRRDVHPYQTGPYEIYTVQDHWQPEVDRILTNYFPARREILLKQFAERGLFPPPPVPPK